MIVVDASVIVTALADDGRDGDHARRRLRGEQLVAPQLLDVEVLSAWRRLAAAGHLDARRVAPALDDLRRLPADRVPHGPFLGRCWELRSNVTIADAVYVALAEAAGLVLLTADRKLAEAPGPRCEIEVLA